MAVLSKFRTLNYTCYELGHTWDPYCTSAAFGVAKAVFRESLKIYGSLYLIAALIKKRGKDYYIKKLIPETLRSTIFLTTNGAMFVIMFCLWRKIIGKFYYITSAFLPTASAALFAILVERKSRRGLLAVYVANLATETAYNMALSRGWFSPIKNGEIWMFSVACSIYFYLFRSKNGLPNSTVSGLKFLVGKEECPDVIYEERAVEDNHNIEKSISSNPSRFQKYLPAYLHTIYKYIQQLQHSSKHSLCHHRTGCVYYILQGFVRMFGTGFCMQAAIKLFSSFTKILRQPRLLLSSVFHTDCFKFGSFLGCFSAVFRGTNCALRWSRNKDDRIHGLISGFLAGWMMLWYRSSTIALYIASKLVETLYFKGIDKGVLPYIKWADVAIYAISTALAFHAAALEPHNLRPAYWKFLNRVTDNKWTKLNHNLMTAFNPAATKLDPNFWPRYDKNFTKLKQP